ncbi:MAG: hypothetical protein IPM55_03155 [Acidobacteria bacterium]|nr:hypothetical protein [Acidobacteriota bacterium]
MTRDHVVTLSRLAPGTRYHFRVLSKDEAGQTAISNDQSFETAHRIEPAKAVPGKISTATVINNPASIRKPVLSTGNEILAPPPPPALPTAGKTFVDPTFGTMILRLTDSRDGRDNHNSYSYWPSFNSNSTHVWINCSNAAYLYDFDPVNFLASNKRPLFQKLPSGVNAFIEDAIWSSNSAEIIFFHDTMRLWSYNVVTSTYTLIKDFRGPLPPGNLVQMSKSDDDMVFAFTFKDTNYKVTGYVVWNRQTNLLTRHNRSPLDEVQIDKTGRYLLVKTGQSGNGIVEGQVLDLATGSIEDLIDNEPDFNPGHSDMGRGFVIGHDNHRNRSLRRELATPHDFTPVFEWLNDWSQGYHISLLASDESWMLISTYDGGSHKQPGPFHNEIFQVATDGSKRVRRLAHHQSVIRDYWDTPRANISRDGRFIVFTSNWRTQEQRDVFILKVP